MFFYSLFRRNFIFFKGTRVGKIDFFLIKSEKDKFHFRPEGATEIADSRITLFVEENLALVITKIEIPFFNLLNSFSTTS